jgi:DNA-binding NarL/FixJ family response regulator
MRYLKILSENTRGEANRRAVLTEAIVREIRQRFRAGEKNSAIAKALDLNISTVRNVTSRACWSHVE